MLKLATIRYLKAERDLKALYSILEYHCPKEAGLADWRNTQRYKKLLKELGEPIRTAIKHNKELMDKLSNLDGTST